jgi:CubicO group peptidase (beta-lactamase class C family)
MRAVEGRCGERFEPLRRILQANLESGADCGASIALVHEGEMVVDLWGGWADEAHTTPWGEHTIVNVWSTTKTMMAISALVLVDRGLLDVDAPVAEYWPEFAANGKQGVLVRHLLSHTSGVSAWAQPVAMEDLYDWERSTAMLAAQEPWWEPGTACGYHALNQGHLVGEVIRRITGRKLGQFFADEIAGPVGADFHIGLAPDEFGRISNIIPPAALPIDPSTIDPTGITMRTFLGPPVDASAALTAEWRQADIGAANGHGNARSVALVQSAMSHGGVANGVRLLSPETIDVVFREQAHDVDLVLGVMQRFGIGYGLPESTTYPFLPPDGRICFWGGWGGSFVINDRDHGFTFAYMMNRMEPELTGDPRGSGLIEEVYRILG